MMKEIRVGDRIPDFILPDQNGNELDIRSVLGKKDLVIYFYPKDDTGGCTKEACSFRDQYEDFIEMGAEVIGISSDDVDSHKQFAARHRLPFILLSDQKSEVRRLFGVPTNFLGLIQGRVTYVINREGIVIHIFNSQRKAVQHIHESLQALKELKNSF